MINFITRTRSKLGSQGQEAGESSRALLTANLRKAITVQMAGFASDLSTCTFERKRSSYKGTRADLLIYDGEGKLFLHGREMDGGALAFWS